MAMTTLQLADGVHLVHTEWYMSQAEAYHKSGQLDKQDQSAPAYPVPAQGRGLQKSLGWEAMMSFAAHCSN